MGQEPSATQAVGTSGQPDASATDPNRGATNTVGDCANLPTTDDLKRLLAQAAGRGTIGGLNGGKSEWAAVVNRSGALCAVAASTPDPAAAWPGSQAIAKSKAYTANAFSTDTAPLSTARLYTLTQPGFSLYSLANANPFNPDCLAAPDRAGTGQRVCGGTIVFGGGVPLYREGHVIGALGASGDTSCADHEMAKRMREAAGLDPSNGSSADDIVYPKVDGPSIYGHPLCPNTWRNGEKIGDEQAPSPSSYSSLT